MLKKLKIVYGGNLDVKLDKALQNLLIKFDWDLIGSGFDIRTNERDLGFVETNLKERINE